MWFFNEIFPIVKAKMPGIKLTNIVGTSKQNKTYKLLSVDGSVTFEGIVPNVQPFYHRASVCIAPLLTGSGTRLKILEAMSFGNPVVSTIIGAEGIGYEKGKHLQVADMPELFASAITSLLQNNYRFNSQRVDAIKNWWKKITTAR